MLKKSICTFCVILLCLPLLSGCWDSLDIEKSATILGIAIDKVESGDAQETGKITHFDEDDLTEEMIRLTAQISVPGRIPLGPETGGGGGEQEPVWVLRAIGHTIDDAMLNLQQELADEIFLGHLRIIVVSEEIAREGVERFNDFLRRQPEVRRTTWMVVSKEEAARYMEVAPKLERVPGLYVTAMVDNAVDLGKFPNDFAGIFWSHLSSKGQDGYLPYLKIKDEDNIEIEGLSYFKGEKMIGVIDPIEIGLFMGAINQKQGGYGAFIQVPDTKERVLVRAERRNTKTKTAIKDGKPEVHLRIRYEGEIEEKTVGNINIDDPKIIQKIEKQATKETTAALKKLIAKLQEEESDIFGFGERIRAEHPSYWNKQVKTKENWHNIYKDIDIHVEMTTHIRRVGMKEK
ncbi:Ger(x)C family spore germination protein [Pueribacillus theae]|uniref:Ger(X)C family spore germination protein n=1 Tax=Pueribacillus theae TaxID=2171751 RepID=A0A2U1JYW5_9BACI|nr:Ger(x)C family spore germination protein [Pueribacillus theae]PWA10416.1 Ger(x)C family spore germination protein [Pueribacillus theae]